MQKEQIEIHLRYEGPDVDDGTMSVQDVVPVLQGFASAYGKLATAVEPQSTHRLRIVGVRPGSADIVLEVWKVLGDNVNALTAASILATGGYFIVKRITEVIRLKRHVKNQPFAERIAGDDSVVVSNSQNVTIEVTLDVYDLFKSGVIDPDLNKIVSPLREDHINAAEIGARSPDGTALRERITVEERPFFDTSSTAVTKTGETWLVAKLNSLTKSTNSGWLYLQDGTRAFYRFVGDSPHRLHHLFGTHSGPVDRSLRCAHG